MTVDKNLPWLHFKSSKLRKRRMLGVGHWGCPLTLTTCLSMSYMANSIDLNAVNMEERRMKGKRMEIPMSGLAICALLGLTYTKHEYANATARCFSVKALVSIQSVSKNFVQGVDLKFQKTFWNSTQSNLSLLVWVEDCDGFVMDN